MMTDRRIFRWMRVALGTATCLVALTPLARAQSIVTVAGGGTSSQEGLAATSVIFASVEGLATDRNGNLYIADTEANVIHRVSAADGTISIFAGNGGGTFSGDNGPARNASLKFPRQIVFDDDGNLYIADYGNGRIRRVDTNGTMTTFAGNGGDAGGGDIGDGGLAVNAVVPGPSGLAWHDGNLYVTDVTYQFNTVRRIDRQGIITTVAGTYGPSGYSGDGGPATGAQFATPLAVAVDAAGNLFIADSENSVIRRVDAATNIVTTVAGGGSPADGIGDDGLGTDATLAYPTALAIDSAGHLLIADAYNHYGLVRKYDPITRKITRVAGNATYGGGDDGPALDAGIYAPFALTIDGGQNIFVHDGSNNSVRRIDAATQVITRVAGGGSFIGDGFVAAAAVLQTPLGLAVASNGDLILTDTGHTVLRKVSATTGIISTIAGKINDCCGGDEGLPATESSIGFPIDAAIGPDGLVYFAAIDVVRRINADGTLTVVAGGGAPQDGVGDNGPATAAQIHAVAVSFDAAGNLYITDYAYGEHHRIRKVDASTKTISTIAGSDVGGYSGDDGAATSAQLDSPSDAVVDRAGNVFIADTGNGVIRRIDRQSGVITTYAGGGNPPDGIGDGGAATDASITPLHMAIDPRNDDLYFADQNGHRVRKIDAATHGVTTVAGRGTSYLDGEFSGDNGPATDAKLNFEYEISGVAVDSAGRVFVADSKNGRIRMINACTSVAAPTLTAPADGSPTSTGPTLVWNPAAGALRYDVLLDTVDPPAKVAAAGISVTSFTPANLQPGTSYFWSVVAKGDPFCTPVTTATSRVSTFTTGGACAAGAFDAIAPAAGAPTNTAIVTLTWQPSAGAATYDVYLGDATPAPLVAAGITATSYDATVSSGSYTWFVVAHAACDPNRTTATAARTFQSSVAIGCVPGELQVTLLAPPAGASDPSTSVELRWSANQSVTAYDLYFGPSPNPPLLAAGITATTQTVNGLTAGTTYFWRIAAHGPCDPAGVLSIIQTFTTRACDTPGDVTITFAAPSVSVGSTYTILWSAAAGLDAGGGYLVERSTSPDFAHAESQVTSSTAASFVATAVGTYYHRVRAVSACNPNAAGQPSSVKAVTVTAARPNVVFTVLPTAVVAALGERIENRIGTFALENLGTEPLQVLVGRQEIASPPFFSIVDPTATDAAFVTLEPRTPKTFQIRYAGPPNDRSGSYQGVIFVAATGAGLAVTPYAFVNLKIGGGAAVTPVFSVDGVPAEYVAFPGFAGDDANRAPRTITITNPGTTPMDLAAEIGPEVWLVPEANWNATPLAAGESRTVNLFTRRSRSPNGSPLPRYTYFTVRTRDGASARLLVQDDDDLAVSMGRSTRLDLASRSFIVPDVVSQSRVSLSNVGSEAVQSELIFTPADADGFDATAVRRATVVIPPNDVVTLTDPLQQVFHLAAPTAGSLEVRVPRERVGLVAVASTVTGSGGHSVPAVNRGEGARLGSPHVIAGITTPAALTIAETGGVDGANARVRFFDAAGAQKGELTAAVARYGSKRFDDIGAFISGGSLEGGRADVVVESGAGSLATIAVVDGATLTSSAASENASASAVAMAVSPSADTLPSVTTVVPVLAPPTSSGAAPKFVTTVGFLAHTSLPASFIATYRSALGAASVTRTVEVPAGAVKVYSDIGTELFGVPSASGSVSVQIVAAGKVYAFLQSTAGATPRPYASLPVQSVVSEALTSAAGGAQRSLFYDGLEQSVDSSRGTRWMLVLNEVAGSSGAIDVRLYEAGNRSSPIAAKTVPIGPYEQRQLDTVFASLGLEASGRKKDRTNVQVVVTAVGGKARVSAMAVSIDNRSGDTKTFALAPSIGSATPSVDLVRAVVPDTQPGRRRAVRH